MYACIKRWGDRHKSPRIYKSRVIYDMFKDSSTNVKGTISQADEEISFIEAIREGDSEAAEVVRDQELEVDAEEERDEKGETKETEG